MNLAEAREWFSERMDEGVVCPCCHRYGKVYRRKINSGQAVSLIKMYRSAGLGWVHVPTVIGMRSREEQKLSYWGLVREELAEHPQGRSGWWRVTEKGESWLEGRITVAKYARVYDGRCLALDETEQVSIKDALGTKFDYADLMAGR